MMDWKLNLNPFPALHTDTHSLAKGGNPTSYISCWSSPDGWLLAQANSALEHLGIACTGNKMWAHFKNENNHFVQLCESNRAEIRTVIPQISLLALCSGLGERGVSVMGVVCLTASSFLNRKRGQGSGLELDCHTTQLSCGNWRMKEGICSGRKGSHHQFANSSLAILHTQCLNVPFCWGPFLEGFEIQFPQIWYTVYL